MKSHHIATDRLSLFPLTLEQLRLYLDEPEELEKGLGLSVSRSIITNRLKRALGMKIEKMDRANESDHPWFSYWLIVIRETSFGAGMAGFKGLPNEKGEVEIGYGIDPECQGKGYMTEAVEALVAWAFQNDRCLSVIAPDTKRSNIASNRVLEKVGMRVYYETEDALYWRIDKESN